MGVPGGPLKPGKDMLREAKLPLAWGAEGQGFTSLRGGIEVACEERPLWFVVVPRMHMRRKGRFLPGVGSVRVKGPILFRGG